jgi:hypothetical protein
VNAKVLSRRPSAYRTSFPIEELEVELPGGGRSRIVAKRLDRASLGPAARFARPSFLHAPRREAYVYERLLPRGPEGPPRFLEAEQGADGSLLLIEWIDGRVLFEVGERAIWEEAASWLGRFHAAFEGAPADPPLDARLVERDADFHRLWLARARDFAVSEPRRGAALDWLAARHEDVVEALVAMDPTLLHGEFYASNVLVAEAESSTRVAPVDWELAGPGARSGGAGLRLAGDRPGGDAPGLRARPRPGARGPGPRPGAPAGRGPVARLGAAGVDPASRSAP